MADSVQEKIMAAVKARIQAINGTGSYSTDLSANVFVWKTGDWEPGELPGVSLNDVLEEHFTDTITSTRQVERRLTVEACAACAATTDSLKYARSMAADIELAIKSDDTWTVSGTRLAFRTLIIKKEFGIEQKDKTYAGVKVTFQIIYRTPRLDPMTPQN